MVRALIFIILTITLVNLVKDFGVIFIVMASIVIP